jgi:hypothetical protein
MSRTRRLLVTLLAGIVLMLAMTGIVLSQEEKTYVGSKVCADCHPAEYENFSKYAKKSHSFESIRIMASDLTAEEVKECYVCHTTGYGEPTGFKSFEKTPDLAHAGCEVCHGPGSLHVDYGGDPSVIKRDLSIEDCETCHNEERVSAFNFKPLLYGGAH